MASTTNSSGVTFTTSGSSGTSGTLTVTYEGTTQTVVTGNPGVAGLVASTNLEFLTGGTDASLIALANTYDYVVGPNVNETIDLPTASVLATNNIYVGGSLDLADGLLGAASGTHVYVYGGTLTADSSAAIGALSGTTIDLEDGGVLVGGNNNALISALNGATISFGTGGGTIQAEALSGSSVIDLLSSSTVDGFNSASDVIDFGSPGANTITNYVVSASSGESTITLYDGTTEIGQVQVAETSGSLAVSGTYSAGESGPLTVTKDASGTGFDITAAPSTFEVVALCFCEGTMIATPDGEVPVETLRRGDFICLADGSVAPLRWLGYTTISTRFSDPLRFLPVRIPANLFGDGFPRRDLLLSPDHALLVDGVLVQAGALVDDVIVTRVTTMPERFRYYHVEIEAHDLVLAEGMPAESFVDNVDRMNFDNWEEFEKIHGDGEAIEEMSYPRVKSARQLPRTIRARLANAAEAMGRIPDVAA